MEREAVYVTRHRCDAMDFKPRPGQIAGLWRIERDVRSGAWRICEAGYDIYVPVTFCPWCGTRLDAPVSGPTLEERVAALECWRLCQTGD